LIIFADEQIEIDRVAPIPVKTNGNTADDGMRDAGGVQCRMAMGRSIPQRLIIEHLISQLSAVHAKLAGTGSIIRHYEAVKRESSSTSSRLPTMSGVRWWSESGAMSRMREWPLVAMPPACSARKAMGLAS